MKIISLIIISTLFLISCSNNDDSIPKINVQKEQVLGDCSESKIESNLVISEIIQENIDSNYPWLTGTKFRYDELNRLIEITKTSTYIGRKPERSSKTIDNNYRGESPGPHTLCRIPQ